MAQYNTFISCKESRIESNRSFYGCFYLGPFDSSQSLTVANALRRVLLSECTGLGIVSVTIENVTHEYSTIPGMRESVLDLILNLKEIVFRKQTNTYSSYKKNSTIYNQIGNSYFKPVSGFLKVKGPGVIRAKDLKLPPFLECVDPEQYIATLAEDGLLCMKFIIMEGKGYLFQTQKMNGVFDTSSKEDTNLTELFIDSNVVKNRLSFLKEIKNYMVKTNNFSDNIASSKAKAPFGLYSDLSGIGKTKNAFISQKKLNSNESDISFFEDKKGNSSNSSNLNVLKNKTKKDQMNMHTSLNIDTVFNPITKVSYVIEDFDNKIVDDSNLKVNFVNDISTLLESSDYLKTNLPFLTKQIELNQTDLSNFVDLYSTSDIQKLSGSLHPLKKQSPLHTIVLEIWTNGSLHPREALYAAFENLASTFLNLQKTKSYSSIYANESSFLAAALNNKQTKPLQNKEKNMPLLGNLNQPPQTSQQPTQISSNSILSNSVETQYTDKNSTLFNNNQYESFKDSFDSNQGIECLNISLRPYTLLKRSNIHTLSDLCQLNLNDLKYICGFNHKYVSNIVESLRTFVMKP